MREQNFVLIRHANMIFVHDLNVEIPSTMIETIPLTELPNRGRFEMTQTEFDVSGIDADSFFDQIQPLVRDQGGKSLLLPLSNILFVQRDWGATSSDPAIPGNGENRQRRSLEAFAVEACNA